MGKKLIREGEYLKGKKNGFWKNYNDDGSLNHEIEYLNGEETGKYKNYY